MIERVHEHLTGELRQNTRTDTIFILTAILLNLVILAINSFVAGTEGFDYDPVPTLTEGNHILYIEVFSDEEWEWRRAGEVELEFTGGKGDADRQNNTMALPDGSRDIRYQLDANDESGWAVASERYSRDVTNTIVMFVFILLQVFVNVAVIFGLLKGKKMRMVILDGLMHMYKDQKVEMYYSESLLKSYSVRYYIFISVVVFLGVISIAVPLILTYL